MQRPILKRAATALSVNKAKRLIEQTTLEYRLECAPLTEVNHIEYYGIIEEKLRLMGHKLRRFGPQENRPNVNQRIVKPDMQRTKCDLGHVFYQRSL